MGENGSGKTSVLRIFYYFLTCNWAELIKFKFKKVVLKINEEYYEISHSDIEQNIYTNDKILRHLPPFVREKVKKALCKGDIEEVETILMKSMSPLRYREFRNHFLHYQYTSWTTYLLLHVPYFSVEHHHAMSGYNIDFFAFEHIVTCGD